MRIGLTVPTPGENPDLATLLTAMERADALGLHAVWMPNISSRGFDAAMALALGGARTARLELGTFVVPTFTRHPVVMAQQALTAQAATGGRFVLGIGLSHRVSMEGQFGFDFSRPIRHMREYLTCLAALFSGQTVDFAGEEFRIRSFALIPPPGVAPPPILVAALGPQMLRLAGQLSAGTAIWVGGPRYVAVAAKAIGAAAREAGRPAPARPGERARLRDRPRAGRPRGRRRVLRPLRPAAVLPGHPRQGGRRGCRGGRAHRGREGGGRGHRGLRPGGRHRLRGRRVHASGRGGGAHAGVPGHGRPATPASDGAAPRA